MTKHVAEFLLNLVRNVYTTFSIKFEKINHRETSYLTFMGPCIVNIFSECNQQDATFDAGEGLILFHRYLTLHTDLENLIGSTYMKYLH